ncbi:MAG: hypothetical protein VX589_13235 [Myxococcota bacterium]|nr:hypothetical protein [Myxococcota bacterium]
MRPMSQFRCVCQFIFAFAFVGTSSRAEPVTPTHERTIKGLNAAAPVQIEPIHRDGLKKRRYVGDLPPSLRTIQSHHIPLLLPKRVLTWHIETSHQHHWLALTAKNPDFIVAIHGTTLSHQRPELKTELDNTGPSSPPVIVQQHGITTVRFKAFNVGYFMVIQCRTAAVTDRCASPDFASTLWGELVVIGGQP